MTIIQYLEDHIDECVVGEKYKECIHAVILFAIESSQAHQRFTNSGYSFINQMRQEERKVEA